MARGFQQSRGAQVRKKERKEIVLARVMNSRALTFEPSFVIP